MFRIVCLELTSAASAESSFLYLKFPANAFGGSNIPFMQIALEHGSPFAIKPAQTGTPDVSGHSTDNWLHNAKDGTPFPTGTGTPLEWLDIKPPHDSEGRQRRGMGLWAARGLQKLSSLPLLDRLRQPARTWLSKVPYSPFKGQGSGVYARQTATANAASREALNPTALAIEQLLPVCHRSPCPCSIRAVQRGGHSQCSTSNQNAHCMDMGMGTVLSFGVDGDQPCILRNPDHDRVRSFRMLTTSRNTGMRDELTLTLDTGATCNVITRSMAKSMGYTVFLDTGGKVVLKGIGKTLVKSPGAIEIPLWTRCNPEVRDYVFHVVEDDDLAGHLVLAGMNLIVATGHLQLRSCVACGIP